MPIEAFTLTKDHSPRVSQDDKIFPEHFQIIQDFKICLREHRRIKNYNMYPSWKENHECVCPLHSTKIVV